LELVTPKFVKDERRLSFVKYERKCRPDSVWIHRLSPITLTEMNRRSEIKSALFFTVLHLSGVQTFLNVYLS
jgi:hypothetical protein